MSESLRQVPLFRIFLSSPGDVAEERRIAREVIESVLPKRVALEGKAAFQVVDWSHPKGGVPMSAWETPQEAINRRLGKPSDCDLTIVILWGRMGTPLPEDYHKPDGSHYLSGTEWEFEDARKAKPGSVYLYRRISPPVPQRGDAAELREMAEQRERLEHFFTQFRNDDGSYRGSVNTYETPADFENMLASHLENIVHARLSPKTPEVAPEPEPPDDRTPQDLSAHLKAAFQREETSAVREEIRDLQRQLRKGGQLQAGDFLVRDRFELLEMLGQGGFAKVWKAYDKQRREIVAIKVLHGQYAQDPTRRERFFLGARLMASLRHPGIVRVYEANVVDEGYYFFVMEHVAGTDFRRAVMNTCISLEQRLDVIQAVGEALSYAHEQGLVHRDVKPANILLDGACQPKLTDFDLVREEGHTTSITRTGTMGSVFYAAPEMFIRPQDSGAPADIYGLAMTTVFALYGAELPMSFLRNPPGFIDQLEVPDRVKSVLNKGTTDEAGDRWESVAALCEALNQVHLTGVSTFRDPFLSGEGEGPEMVQLPGGAFTMGDDCSPQDEDKPAHQVAVRAFAIGQYPVTFEAYEQFCKATGRELPDDSGWGRGTRPVVQVDWSDAVAYCKWLSEQTGMTYRLPTEAEWEYACRAGSDRRYSFGNQADQLGGYGWSQENSERMTHPVGEKSPNTWSLYDMHGNVWEWVKDRYARDYYRRSPRDNPSGPEIGSARVVRGGSWSQDAQDCRSASRFHFFHAARLRYIGFRLARDASPYAPCEVFRDRLGEGSEGPEIVYLPGGTFRMGDIQGHGYELAQPVHDVTLDAFAIGRYPVTVDEYMQFVDDTGRHHPEWLEVGSKYHLESGSATNYPRKGVGRDRLRQPVVGIAWADAMAYCGWLSERTGAQYGLPTEAEWEYACRAGSESVYAFGDDEATLREYAWYVDNTAAGLPTVGEKKPNAWGLFDMYGCVYEWVQDWYEDYASESRVNPRGPEEGSVRVVRGGSWLDDAESCRSASRLFFDPTVRNPNLGFRLARRV